jgi:hypothetical protein
MLFFILGKPEEYPHLYSFSVMVDVSIFSLVFPYQLASLKQFYFVQETILILSSAVVDMFLVCCVLQVPKITTVD